MPAKKKKPVKYPRMSRQGIYPNKEAYPKSPVCRTCKNEKQVLTWARLGYRHWEPCPVCQPTSSSQRNGLRHGLLWLRWLEFVFAAKALLKAIFRL